MMSESWDQQPGESGPAFEAFKLFREMGPARTIVGAYGVSKGCPRGVGAPKAKKRVPGTWQRWASKHEWSKRAAAYDSRAATVERAATEAVIAQVATDRAAKVLQQEHMEQRVAGLLFAKAIEMLEVCAVRRREVDMMTPNGVKRVTIQEPVKWNFGTVAKVLQVAHQIGRASLNMPVRIDPREAAEAPYFESSGELEAATAPGSVPAMPAETHVKPQLGVSVVGPAGAGLIQPKKERPGDGRS